MRCVILCAGLFGELNFSFLPGDYIICCDGGYDYALKTGVRPQLIVGDFDSVQCPLPDDIEILRFPAKKDDTDSMIAVRAALARGCDEIILLYATGNRLDHTVANLTVLQFIVEQGAKGRLVGVGEEVWLIRDAAMTFPAQEGSSLSVFAWGEQAVGVTLSGVAYPLCEHTLTNAFPLGLGNRIVAQQAVVSVRRGSLLVIKSKI